MYPEAEDVAAFTGRNDLDTVTVDAHLSTITHMVKAYTRDRGFDPSTGEPGDDVAAVIVSACARLVTNPEHTESQQLGTFSIRQGVFNGWTLPELAILHRYRKRAQ